MYWNQELKDLFWKAKRREIYAQLLDLVPGQEEHRRNVLKKMWLFIQEGEMLFPGFSIGRPISVATLHDAAIARTYMEVVGYSYGPGPGPNVEDFVFGGDVVTPFGTEPQEESGES